MKCSHERARRAEALAKAGVRGAFPWRSTNLRSWLQEIGKALLPVIVLEGGDPETALDHRPHAFDRGLGRGHGRHDRDLVV
jgi:hypothetical protein